MKCNKFCGSPVSIRRALFLAAGQIILALVIVASSDPAHASGVAEPAFGIARSI